MAGKIKAMWTNKDIRNRILFTLFAFLVYRLGSAITVPDVNTADLVNGIGENSLFAMLNLLGGGGLEQFSVFALGVTPYITASIIIQLLSMDVIPHLTELSKAGANGRKTLDKYTRYLAVVFAFVQSFSLVYGFSKAYTGLIVGGVTISKILYIATIFAAGSMFLVWVGDQISMKGIGNGISMVIMAGIVGRMPQQFSSAWSSLITGESAPTYGAWLFATYILVYLLIIIFVTLINTAERRIPIQYTSSSISLSKPSEANYLPLKVNSASVIPVIFASSLMMAPIQIASFFPSNDFIKEMQKWLGLQTWYSLVIYVLLILFFTFFYTKMQINPEKVAENLGKSGSYIPSVRPGNETKEYINRVLSRITVLGSVALAIIAVMPHIMPLVWPDLPNSMALGGTGMIIVVGVAIETVRQVQGLITQKSYKNITKTNIFRRIDMNIFIMGAPGSGKGTFSTKIKEEFNLNHISTGDIFRANIAGGTELGLQAKAYSEKGLLVPDEITNKMVKDYLNTLEDKKNGYLLDGYPRTLAQAKAFEEMTEGTDLAVEKIVYMDVPFDELTRRITGRRTCKNVEKSTTSIQNHQKLKVFVMFAVEN